MARLSIRLRLMFLFMLIVIHGVAASAEPYEINSVNQSLVALLSEYACQDTFAPFLELVPISEESMIREVMERNELGYQAVGAFTKDDNYFRFAKEGFLIRYGEMKTRTPALETPLRKEEVVEFAERLIALRLFDPKSIPDITYNVTDRSQDKEENETDLLIERRYKGYFCASWISVRVDRDTGTIKEIMNIPFVPPKSLEDTVAKEEALKIATRYAEQRGATDTHDISKMIAFPNKKGLFGGMKKNTL